MRLVHIGFLGAALTAATSYAVEPPPREVVELFAMFDVVCIQSGGAINTKQGPFADMIKQGSAKEIGSNAWIFRTRDGDMHHEYIAEQTNLVGHQLCKVEANHGAAEEVRKTGEYITSRMSQEWGGSVAHASKPMGGNPDIVLDLYEFTIPGKEHPAVISISTTDSQSARPRRNALVFEAAK